MNEPRPREWLHTKACLASAMIAAIENARDSDSHFTDHDFRIMAQNNEFLEWADDYLADGTKTCLCPEPVVHTPEGNVNRRLHLGEPDD